MPKLATEKLTARRRQILEAARSCFIRNGIHSTSMRDIYEEAGVSAGLIYRYFPSKRELINSLVKDWDREVIVRLDSFSLSENPQASLISVFDQLADWILGLSINELRLLVHFWPKQHKTPTYEELNPNGSTISRISSRHWFRNARCKD